MKRVHYTLKGRENELVVTMADEAEGFHQDDFEGFRSASEDGSEMLLEVRSEEIQALVTYTGLPEVDEAEPEQRERTSRRRRG